MLELGFPSCMKAVGAMLEAGYYELFAVHRYWTQTDGKNWLELKIVSRDPIEDIVSDLQKYWSILDELGLIAHGGQITRMEVVIYGEDGCDMFRLERLTGVKTG